MRRIFQRIRANLIHLLAGKDISIMTNVVLVGTVYPRGEYAIISSNFIMGNKNDLSAAFNLTLQEGEVNDQVNVDNCS